VVSLGKNRDRLGIVADILEVSDTGANKTRIMFSANLSFKLLEKYLNVVTTAGFLEVNGSIYVLTEQGREFLKRYSSFHEQNARAQELFHTLDNEHYTLTRLCERNRLVNSSGQQ
jgi:predicted transcriptional regulator